ncbi:PLP-dependent transferase [Ammoniphilus sp. CFH 90114]|uniref:PLP-dependent transferase n=1 Tax=Ammoniphilus sp. CFH 90114 TaxID=2493665 RepID=UPI00100DB9D0|nr:PLP-dependent transferase [Ammoniphilus sp. CFH 90114]RXT13547.1 methionine biosynthesis PLP-dependent protein [Ammoniphilus sp. CFH 90114]
MDIETKLVQIGNRREKETGAISFPVTFSTAFLHPALGESTGFDYIRTKNPTRTVLEEAIAEIEGGDRGFAMSSGMAAIHVIMGLFKPGDHIIASLDLYGGTYRLFEQVWKSYGLTFSYVNLRSGSDLQDHLLPETTAVFIETPTNPMMITADISSIASVAKKQGVLTIVDNTFLSPYYQKPILEGADISFHSATKYLGGHNDVLAGLIVSNGQELSDRLFFLQNSIGAVLGPMDSWLLIRGMKTLALRMERHTENAKRIVSFLKEHPLITDVLYAGLGGMVSFRVKDAALVPGILRHLRVISFAESLGGVESLLTYPAVQTHADVPKEVRDSVGVCDRLLRFSVGVEHAQDLVEDLRCAIEASELQLRTGEV